MHIPNRIANHSHGKIFKALWKRINRRRLAACKDADMQRQITDALQNTKIIDPVKDWAKPKEVFTPPVPDDPQWHYPQVQFYQNTQTKDWHEDKAYVMTPDVRFIEGVKQAAILSKCKVNVGLPPIICEKLSRNKLVEDQDHLVQRVILQSLKWDTTEDKLPRRTDKEKPGYIFPREYGIPDSKSRNILSHELLRLAATLSHQIPDLSTASRRVLCQHYISANYQYRGDQSVVIQHRLPYVLTSDRQLPLFGDEETVDATTVYNLPEMWPVNPIIDLRHQNLYISKNSTGFLRPYDHGILNTIFVHHRERWNADHTGAAALMFCLGACLAQARQLYGDEEKTLPRPVAVQCIGHSCTMFNFVCFQLNTLDLSSRDGVKNLAWVDLGNRIVKRLLRQPWKWEESAEYMSTRFVDYDPSVFDKFLAVYLHGAGELQRRSEDISPLNSIHVSS